MEDYSVEVDKILGNHQHLLFLILKNNEITTIVLIPNINQKILKKPFYEYVVNDALKVNKEVFIITNKKINFI